MYRNGHHGVSLLLYAPIGFVLLVTGAPGVAILGGAVMLALATLPDVDHVIPLIEHRGPTHTFAFAGLIGAVVGSVAYTLAPQLGLDPGFAGITGVGIGCYAILAHLAGDVLTPSGIEPFWPLSSRNYSLNLTRADDVMANWLLLGLGVTATVVAAVAAGRVA